MKKFIPFYFIVIFIFIACEKNDKSNFNDELHQNSAIPISSNSKAPLGYQISMRTGHPKENCSGCTTQGGNHIHIECQGAGSACAQKATLYLYPDENGKDFYFAISYDDEDLTDGDFFLMPDRSLYIIGTNGEFLNIPEQVLYRDEETGKLIVNDIFFSNYQAFENQ
ncbi:MAG: hypothetical protein FWC41_01135 [Firmicutes bacterium]|nr:hypothetical protein [Bacillota bacterium]